MNHQYYSIEIKSFDEKAGTFTGLASVPDIQDRVGDIIEKGAFKRTLKANKSRFPLLWQHDTEKPIGVIDLEETDKGLEAVGHLNLEVGLAREARALAQQGALGGLSIGYEIPKGKSKLVENIRRISEIKLWEVSMVTFPANPKAVINDVKSDEDEVDASASPEAEAEDCNLEETELTLKAVDALLSDIHSATSELLNPATETKEPASNGDHSISDSVVQLTQEIRRLAESFSADGRE